MGNHEELFNNLHQEMKRGTLVLAVLAQLDKPQYGYSLMSILEEKGLQIDQNTLYPLLRRLEKQGMLESIWDVEGSRPRRYYKISSLGISVRHDLISEWKSLNKVIGNLIGGNQND
ncbi:PadR family transcriptional regulator [Gudongella sp. SC589]|jgi:DNA-binding PadR family transcriptional regulator|uniref:PadR family transcriptional regulator n=1 Tax=Gudongella sp. SC589 TaxID=3385990 RepID=UPI00390485E1